HITFPLIIPIFKISIVLAFIGSLQAFEKVMVMTAGGPAHATDVISTHMYNMSFLSMKYGYGSAIAAFLVAVCLIATLIIIIAFNTHAALFVLNDTTVLRRNPSCVTKGIVIAFLSLLVLPQVFPLIWLLLSSFKTNEEILSGSLFALPGSPQWINYSSALAGG